MKNNPDYTTVYEYGFLPEEINAEDILNILQNDYDDENYEILEGTDLIKEIPKGEYSVEKEIPKEEYVDYDKVTPDDDYFFISNFQTIFFTNFFTNLFFK